MTFSNMFKGEKWFNESLAGQRTTQRFFKNHFPFNLMPRQIEEVKPKIVYIARNPKDCAVSWFYYHRVNLILRYTGDFESFAENFMNGLSMNRLKKRDEIKFNMIFDFITSAYMGPYPTHVLEGWKRRNDENVHFIFYEDLKFDLANSLKKLSVFLGHPLKDEDLPKLMEHLQFDNFKKNSAINYKHSPDHSEKEEIVRRGQVGGNPEITKEISEKFDEWSKKNLENFGLKFPFCEVQV